MFAITAVSSVIGRNLTIAANGLEPTPIPVD